MVDRLYLGNRAQCGIGVSWVETGLEQLKEAAGDAGMAAKRIFHVVLAEGGPGLP